MSKSESSPERELLKLCLEALNDMSRMRFSRWFREKFNLHDSYELAAKLDKHFRQEAQRYGPTNDV